MENRRQRISMANRMRKKLERRYDVIDDLLARRERLRLEIEPRFEPDRLQPVIDDRAQLEELATLGVEIAEKSKETAGLQREITIQEIRARPHSRDFIERRMRLVSGRFLTAGEEVWTNEMKRIGEPSEYLFIRNYDFLDCMLALYQQPGVGGEEAVSGPYLIVISGGSRREFDGAPLVRCQISGELLPIGDIQIASIVPDFVRSEAFGPLLFGSDAESLRGSGNFLLLHREMKKWYETYKLVILPFDREQTPIRRWKTAVISSQLNSELFAGRETLVSAFHSQELVFDGEDRPVARFAYFHFVMALVRAKMLDCEGWRDVWAKYYLNPPFPRVSLYMRGCMLYALFAYFDYGSVDLSIINSWVRGNGFYEDEILYDYERDELARRILVGVDEAVVRTEARARRDAFPDDSETESDSSEDSSEAESDGSDDDSGTEDYNSADDSEA